MRTDKVDIRPNERGLASGENKNIDPSVKKGLRKLYKAYVNTLDRAGYGVLVSEIDTEEIGEERGETTLCRFTIQLLQSHGVNEKEVKAKQGSV